MTPVFHAFVEDGKIKIYKRAEFDAYVARLEGEVGVTVKRLKETRSDKQNRYMWAVVIEILANEFGYSKDEMHEILKSMFLREHINFRGQEIVVSKSTASLDTKQMEEYLETVRRWAAEQGINIPLPNEVEV